MFYTSALSNMAVHIFYFSDETENLNRLITSKETESVIIKNLPTNKNQEPYGFLVKFHQIFKEELIPILLKLFQKIE